MSRSATAENVRALPAAARPVSTAGDSASPEALQRLNDALAQLKLHTVLPLLQKAVHEVQADRHQAASELAIKALEIDEQCAVAWHIVAICREKAGDFTTSLKCYESALALNPEEVEIANDLGRLAYVMGMKEIAEQLFARYLLSCPGSTEGANNLACAQRDQMRFDEAIETLRPVIYANPANALLWNTLGTVLAEQGDMDQALTFFDEALRLQPGFAKARYNRANVVLALGEPKDALAECEAAIPGVVLERERSMMRLARATMLIASGDLERGWDAYEERLNAEFSDVTHYVIDRPQWTPETDLAGKSMLLVGEQGLGDEVLFANVIPDLIEALGPKGKLSIAVEPRLIPLFQRSFPTAHVGRHDTYKVDHHTARVVKWAGEDAHMDCWAPMASLLRRFRRSVDDFAGKGDYLKVDPARVAYWKDKLAEAGDGLKVGVVWKSLALNSARIRYYSPFEHWAPVLKTPGARFVNLQYGDYAADLADAKAMGIDIWTPPGIDLKDDLDDVAALTCALDLTIGPANCTTNIAAACGAPTWLISTPGAWPRLGQADYPWYPQMRVFLPPAYNQWSPAMAQVASALAKEF